MFKSFLLALSLTVAAGAVLAQTATTPTQTGNTTMMKPSSATESFVKNAGIGGEFEIESSRIALERARNDDVKRFAQRMIDDHSKASTMLHDVAQREGVMVDEQPKLDPKHARMLEKIRNAGKKAKFDRVYIDAQVAAHKEAVNLFRQYAQNGDNANLKDFAQTTLPTLEDHLKQVEDLQRSKVGSSG